MATHRLETPVKQLLVDLDGTLLGNRHFPLSLAFIKRSLSALKKHGGWRRAASTLLAVNGELNRPSRELTNDLRVLELFSRKMGLPIEAGRGLIREGLSVIFPELKKHFYPVPGSKEFLDWARERYPMILATNPVWPPEIIEMRVRWAGIDPSIFQSITHVRRMHACKPAVEYYQEILDQESLNPEDCFLIGDDVKMDLPATRAGVRVFIVGEYKNLNSLSPPKAKAPAWRGSYRHLKSLLESAPAKNPT